MLKLAMVKRLYVKKIFRTIKICQKICQKIWQKFGKKIGKKLMGTYHRNKANKYGQKSQHHSPLLKLRLSSKWTASLKIKAGLSFVMDCKRGYHYLSGNSGTQKSNIPQFG